ncbi:iron-containing alcohol dehydrogenase [Campylobacter sp. 19-13652]|uniref:iron-containing alcohol dehydrogenase n=1 Tax=Campylobacter sp. 19-13652 TaxID=2840180 RepID=UPI001C75FE67|nr:iron-containing alcohol dehydrogenase [Campylobacter sp. 19-13652]BCX79155.1 alcohol dehydrogenase [Campylobacter sp. 19-13652]
MKNFTYQCPTKLIFGRGEIANLAGEIDKSERVLLVYGGGSIKQNGVYEQVMAALAGVSVVEFGGVEPNPDFDTCVRAAELARSINATCLLAVGGGSVLDACKFIAQIIPLKGRESELYERKITATAATPIYAVLTLPATGSEMNMGCVISRRSSGEKKGFHNPLTFPRVSVVDPATTLSLPPRQIQNGIIDAFVHTIEQYATYDVDTPLQDLWAIGVMRTLMSEGVKSLKNSADYDARANLCWSATCALNYWIGLGVVQDWSVHAIGHELTALYGLDHAQTLAIVLPSLYRLKLSSKQTKLARLGREAFGLVGDEVVVASECVERIVAFFRSLGVKTTLAEYGIDAAEAAQAVAARFSERCFRCGERGDIDAEAVRQILLKA